MTYIYQSDIKDKQVWRIYSPGSDYLLAGGFLQLLSNSVKFVSKLMLWLENQ